MTSPIHWRQPTRRPFFAHAVALVCVALLASACGGSDTGGQPRLTSVTVTPTAPSIAKATSVQLYAAANFSDQSQQDLTADATWSSSDPAVASVSNKAGEKGRVAGLAEGTTTIIATLGETSGSAVVTVTSALPASIAVTPVSPSLAKGLKQQYTATVTFGDGSHQVLNADVTWSSADVGVATISNAAGSQGQATAAGVGSTTITASLSGLEGTAQITVTPAVRASIEVTPSWSRILVGSTLQLDATGVFTDGSREPLTAASAWTSFRPDLASVSNLAATKGQVRGIAFGRPSSDRPYDMPRVSISAALGGLTGWADLEVVRGLGEACNIDAWCLSSICTGAKENPDPRGGPPRFDPGQCCTSSCAKCFECSTGICRQAAAGTNPYGSCLDYNCDANANCYDSCTDEGFNCSSHCSGWCWAGKCQPRMAKSSACLGSCQCISNFCLLFACY